MNFLKNVKSLNGEELTRSNVLPFGGRMLIRLIRRPLCLRADVELEGVRLKVDGSRTIGCDGDWSIHPTRLDIRWSLQNKIEKES